MVIFTDRNFDPIADEDPAVARFNRFREVNNDWDRSQSHMEEMYADIERSQPRTSAPVGPARRREFAEGSEYQAAPGRVQVDSRYAGMPNPYEPVEKRKVEGPSLPREVEETEEETGGAQCPICLQNMSRAVAFKCGHMTCRNCAVKIMNRRTEEQKCPSCRQQIEDPHAVFVPQAQNEPAASKPEHKYKEKPEEKPEGKSEGAPMAAPEVGAELKDKAEPLAPLAIKFQKAKASKKEGNFWLRGARRAVGAKLRSWFPPDDDSDE